MFLTDLPIPELYNEQLQLFTPENIHEVLIGKFNPEETIAAIIANEGQSIMGIDVGGDKIDCITFSIKNHDLVPDIKSMQTMQSESGKGYVAFLEKIAKEASEHPLPIGLAFGGGQTNADGTIAFAPNVSVFAEELTKKYNDFYNLLPTLTAIPPDDTVSGLMAGAVEAKKRFPEKKNIMFVINGSGLAIGILKEEHIILTEIGHTPIIRKLNLGQTRPCEVFGSHVCLERVAASKVGIEDLWFKKTTHALDGKSISRKYIEGNTIATTLYNNSANITAHAMLGIAKLYNLLQKENDTVIIYHGGTFQVPGYQERIKQILEKNIPIHPQTLLTSEFSQNACAQGAALAALTHFT
ncbi:MAG TPA: ROK family protein [Candidatus Saccharimonadales bacterium]|nr:ROK family protein [Candidatus Saccharimonadales bacterium]